MKIQVATTRDDIAPAPGYFECRLATNSDDKELRALLQRTTVGEQIRLTLAREPRIVFGENLGDEQFITVRDGQTKELLSCVSYIRQILSLHGASVPIGYISQGRIKINGLTSLERALILRAGWRFFNRELRGRERIDYCSVTSREGERLVRCLWSPASAICADVPMRTYLMDVSKVRAPKGGRRSVRCATKSDISQLLLHMSNFAASHDLFPVINEPDIKSIGIENFYLAFNENTIVGACAYINRLSEKQIAIRRYPWFLGSIRPLINFASRFGAVPFVPAINKPINFSFGAYCAVDEQELEAFKDLLECLAFRANRDGMRFIAVGLRSGHPFAKQVRSYPAHCFESTILLLNSCKSDLPGKLDSPCPEISIL